MKEKTFANFKFFIWAIWIERFKCINNYLQIPDLYRKCIDVTDIVKGTKHHFTFSSI